jgi:hypothetical protein
VRSETGKQVAIGIKDIDEAVARPRLVVMLTGFLERIGDKEFATNVCDTERRETRTADGWGWELRVDKGTSEVNLVEMLVEDVNGARVEISGEQEVTLGVAAESQSFIDRTRSTK